MTLPPGYGQTPVDPDELAALLSGTRRVLGEPVTKAAVYDLEQAIQVQVAEELLSEVLGGSLPVDDLLTDRFVRDLHRLLYADIWTWAGG